METFQSFIGGRQKIPLDGFLSFTPLSSAQQRYLTNVYALLAASVIATAGGAYFSMAYFALPVFVAGIAQVCCMVYIGATPSPQGLQAKNGQKRLAALLGAGFMFGSTLSHLIRYANFLNPAILPTALLATFAVFFSFSLAAMFAKERQFLFLGSILASVMTYLSIMSFVNLFFYSKLSHDIVLYVGLAVYMGFVLYDTQATLYEHARGQTDVILHALVFYVDAVGIFVRIARILIEKEQQRQRDKRRNA